MSAYQWLLFAKTMLPLEESVQDAWQDINYWQTKVVLKTASVLDALVPMPKEDVQAASFSMC